MTHCLLHEAYDSETAWKAIGRLSGDAEEHSNQKNGFIFLRLYTIGHNTVNMQA